MPAKADTRIAQLAEALHPGITGDPHWPALSQQLYDADREGLSDTQLRRIATARPLPSDQPAAALAYRLIDAIGERTPTNTTTAATVRSTAGNIAPPEPTVRRRPEPTVGRAYEPPPLSAPPTDYARIFGSAPRPGPRR